MLGVSFKTTKQNNKKEISNFKEKPSKKRKVQPSNDIDEIDESEESEELKPFLSMTARELDKSFMSPILKQNKKILDEASNSIEEKVESLEIIMNLLGIETFEFETLSLNNQQKIYPDNFTAKSLQELDSEHLQMIEKKVENSILNNEFQMCLLLFLKLSKMKKELKTKEEILQAKIESALMLKSNSTSTESSLRSLADKMNQIGFLIYTISEKKRELKEIEEDDYIVPLLTRHQTLRLIPLFTSCYNEELLLDTIVELFQRKENE
jgi:hypothetical protein